MDDAVVHQLLAREAIRQQLHAYCRAMDRRDHELGYSVWHDDGTADYGAIFQGSGVAFVDWVCESHLTREAHSHQVTTIGISVDGDNAESEAYVTATFRSRVGRSASEATARGRYFDRWSRRGGRWAIDHRRYIHDFDDVRQITEERMRREGSRDRLDPTYQQSRNRSTPERLS